MDNNRELIKRSQELIVELSTELDRAEKKIEQLQDDIITYDKITNTDNWYNFKEVAKELNYKGYGRNNLLSFLRGHKILRENNEPYQSYVDRGYFKIIVKANDYNDMVHIVPVASVKGIKFIRKLIDEVESE